MQNPIRQMSTPDLAGLMFAMSALYLAPEGKPAFQTEFYAAVSGEMEARMLELWGSWQLWRKERLDERSRKEAAASKTPPPPPPGE